jgi:hypothetical protein
MNDATAALARLWTEAQGDAAALERATFTGADPVLPTDFKIGTAASAVVGATALAASEIWRLRSGRARRRTPDLGAKDVTDLMADMDTPFGRLHYVTPAPRFSETPAEWSRPAVPLAPTPPRGRRDPRPGPRRRRGLP